MRKIITITLNTAIDHLVDLGLSFPAGKGINASRVISLLKEKVIALGFVGKESIHLFNKLNSEYMTVDLIPVEEKTRFNETIVDQQIQQPGYKLHMDDIKKIEEKIDKYLKPQDIVILSGSLPRGLPATTYQHLINYCKALNGVVILDTSHDALRLGIEAKPFMIKPNLAEFSDLFGEEITDDKTIINLVKKSFLKEIPLIVVSLGKEGLLVFDQKHDRIFKANVEVKSHMQRYSSVGSGDCVVGAFGVGLKENLDLQEMIQLGVSCGSANLLTIGPGVCRIEDINKLKKQVKLYKMGI